MSGNTHYDVGAWVDFVRGLCPPALQAEMEAHLSCSECSNQVELLKRLWMAGRRLAEKTVPEDWAKRAEQIFQTETLGPISSLPTVPAILAFDSFTSLAPAPVRAASPSARHVIYQTSDCALDLKLEDTPPLQFSIIGQITDRRAPDASIPATPVFIFAGQNLVAATSSNEFGEFQVACELKSKMRISFPFDGQCIDVMLDTFHKKEPQSE